MADKGKIVRVNSVRGDRTVEIGGSSYAMRHSFEVTEALETRYDTLFNLWSQVKLGKIGVLATALWIILTEDGTNAVKLTREDIGRHIMGLGMTRDDIKDPLGDYILDIMQGLSNPVDDGEDEGGEGAESESKRDVGDGEASVGVSDGDGDGGSRLDA